MSKLEKSINEMSLKELKKYLSSRINSIKSDIHANKRSLTRFQDQIVENTKIMKVIEKSSDVKLLTELGEKYGLDLNPEPMLLELVKVILLDKIKQENKRLENQIVETRKTIHFFESDLKTIDKCPICGGMGQKIEVEYVRQGGKVQPIRHIHECNICGGTGKILNLTS